MNLGIRVAWAGFVPMAVRCGAIGWYGEGDRELAIGDLLDLAESQSAAWLGAQD